MNYSELTSLGLALRTYSVDDTAFIVNSWRRSGEALFLAGKYQPFIKHTKTINNLIHKLDNKLDSRLIRAGNSTGYGTIFASRLQTFGVLKRIYHAEIGSLMNKAMLSPIFVVCDSVNKNVIFGWGCKDYVYVKQSMRGLGLGSLLKELSNAKTR